MSEGTSMAHKLTSKIIAIPSAMTPLAEKIVDLVLTDDIRLALGAVPASFAKLDARIDGREGVYCQPVDLDCPASAKRFFHIAFAQLGRPDLIVFEALPSRARRMTAEIAIEIATRRLLHCLDGALPYLGKDLHLICIAPAYGPAAIPIASAFLAANATARASRVRMSVVSPPSTRSAENDASFARTIVHLMQERRSPDIIEAVLSSRRQPRGRTERLLLEPAETHRQRLQ